MTAQLEMLRECGWSRLFPTECIRINVGMATCGLACGAQDVFDGLTQCVERKNIPARVYPAGCLGACWAEPIVEYQLPGMARIVYGGVTAAEATEILISLLKGKLPSKHLLGCMPTQWAEGWGTSIEIGDPTGDSLFDYPFFHHQEKRISASWGHTVPWSIEEYAALGGYAALAKALDEGNRAKIIQTVEESGLRGCGGAGFPTGRKWRIAADQDANVKYLVANADEGDPGAYMDRGLLESDPHRLIEGMAIAAYAIGATEGIIFTRAEYPLAIRTVTQALEEARDNGLLGSNILGSDFSFDVAVVQSAGSYICGEETALIEVLEGRRPDPRKRPPYPAERGLDGMPTCINNIETFAHIPSIIMHGAQSFRLLGTQSSPGTKLFCLSGSVKHCGLVEIPFGMKLQQLVTQVAELDASIGRNVVCESTAADCAVQIGGPSGSILPLNGSDVVLCFDEIRKAGGIVGSGGIVVLGPRTCIVNTARYFAQFSLRESCGQCRGCRVELAEASELLDALCSHRATPSTIVRLAELCALIPQHSKCTLGKNSIAPLRSGLELFPEVFEEHLAGKCRGLVCKDLMHFRVIEEACIGCLCCLESCPPGAIKGQFMKPFTIDQDKCQKCWMCISQCPYPALKALPYAYAHEGDNTGKADHSANTETTIDPVASRHRSNDSAASCRLCGRCVKACADRGGGALCFIGTGSNRRVAKPAYQGITSCIGCNACRAACPSGAIDALQACEADRLLATAPIVQ